MINIIPFVQVFFSCLILKYACDLFEQSATYMGRNMKAGIKGATVNAIGSSMPELMSCFATLFFMGDPQLFVIGLGITAGSGVFNTAVIPSLSILFAKKEDGSPVDHIELSKPALIRDVFWVVVSDIALIAMIMSGRLELWMGTALNMIYVAYALHLWIDARRGGDNTVEEYEYEALEDRGLVGNILTFNFNKILFGDRELNLGSAVALLAIAVTVITAGSHLLVLGVDGSSSILGIPNFISGLILGAAASSIPDLILSLKDARKGEYEDAVANPLASNTFDTSISVGLPLVLWMMYEGVYGLDITGEGMTALRLSVVAMSASVGATMIFKYKRVTKGTALFMLGLYAAWCGWVAFTYI